MSITKEIKKSKKSFAQPSILIRGSLAHKKLQSVTFYDFQIFNKHHTPDGKAIQVSMTDHISRIG